MKETIRTFLLDFNSRPSARGDAFCLKRRASFFYFNSRPSARGDDSCTLCASVFGAISIHAPPRGATFARAESVLAVFALSLIHI